MLYLVYNFKYNFMENEEIKIKMGVAKKTYTDPITGKNITGQVRSPIPVDQDKDTDIKSKLKQELEIELENGIQQQKLESIENYAKTQGNVCQVKVEKAEDVFLNQDVKNFLTKVEEPIFIVNAKIGTYVFDLLIDKPTTYETLINLSFIGDFPLHMNDKTILVNVYNYAFFTWGDTHAIIYDTKNPKDCLYVNYEGIEI